MSTTRFAIVGLLLATSALACSDGDKEGNGSGGPSPTGGATSGGDPKTSGVATTKKLVSLSEADRGTLCDWQAKQYGGYGKEKTCPGANGQDAKTASQTDKATCVANFNKGIDATCEVTVGEFETIVRSSTTCTAEAGYADAFAKLFGCVRAGL